MPQLNPLPWFTIFLSTWAVFLLTMPHKFSHLPSPRVTPRQARPHTLNPWLWPWY